jgi:hypothetical protein
VVCCSEALVRQLQDIDKAKAELTGVNVPLDVLE